MKVCIFGKRFSPDNRAPVEGLLRQLERRNVRLCIYEPFLRFLSTTLEVPKGADVFSTTEELRTADAVISIGGDGTMLDCAQLVRDTRIPVLGINAGRLGFLANISLGDVEEAIDALVSRNYSLDHRSLIQVKTDAELALDYPYALNEVTILNPERSSMINVHTYVNDAFMNTYWADGLIVSTPTGSTAYSLSCGGPIVTPDSNNLILTPIAAHNLTVRPLVLSNSNKLSLRPQGREEWFQLSLDSRHYQVPAGTLIELTRASFEIHLISLEGQGFFNTIRNKLGWGMDKRN